MVPVVPERIRDPIPVAAVVPPAMDEKAAEVHQDYPNRRNAAEVAARNKYARSVPSCPASSMNSHHP
jgi:hypothetical protein